MASTLCPNSSKALVTARMAGQTFYIGWGTGAGATSGSTATLLTESSETRVAATASVRTSTSPAVTNDTHRLVASLTATAGRVITNAGAFDQQALGGACYVKGDFAAINLNTNDQLTFTFDITYA